MAARGIILLKKDNNEYMTGLLADNLTERIDNMDQLTGLPGGMAAQ